MMRLRQVCLVARDLTPVVDDLCNVLGIEVAYRDPGVGIFGLQNAVMPIGDTFLEVVSPVQPDTTAGRYLEHRGGDGGYMILLQSDQLDEDRTRFAHLGIRTVWSLDLDDIRGTHLHPKDTGGTLLSVDSASPPESWRWAGPDWHDHRRTETVKEITAVALQSINPHTLAGRWAQILAQPVSSLGQNEHLIQLERGTIHFVPDTDGRGEGLSAFEISVTDRDRVLNVARERKLPAREDEIVICGTRIRLTQG